MTKSRVRFGPAGIPLETPKPRDTAHGLQYTKSLGLDAQELEFVRTVFLNTVTAVPIGEIARKLDVSLSAHAPYYINLLSNDLATRNASKIRILNSARAMHAAGGGRIAIHCGFYGSFSHEEAMKQMKREFREILSTISKEKIQSAVLAPEVSGGAAKEWGGLEEVCELAREFGLERVNPCIDFSHQHCRTGKGTLYKREDFARVLDYVEKTLGKKAVQTLHCHVQCVKFSEKGEISHLPLSAEEPPLKPLMQLLAEGGYSGTVICESPLIEKDALTLQKWYNAAK